METGKYTIIRSKIWNLHFPIKRPNPNIYLIIIICVYIVLSNSRIKLFPLYEVYSLLYFV